VARAGAAGLTLQRGTPRFMSPEVARGSVITNSKAIDAYGMGMVVHDIAHINTDAEAPARLAAAAAAGPGAAAAAAAAARASRSVNGGGWATTTMYSSLSASTARQSMLHVLFRRETANYLPSFAPHVPAPLCALIRAALAMQPDERPTLTELRTRLAALAEQADAW
jgi:serine/threonine protein kinase